jgi:aspartate carbamoyltransferase regulatory subunit
MKTKEPKKLYNESEAVIIKRSQIKFAPYNPRLENPKVVSELKKNFKRAGFLGGIVWNENTLNLVSGHKRTQALDLIHSYDGSKEKDYNIRVEKVFYDEKTEKEQNIFLNNKSVQGDFDFQLIAEMLPEIDIENTGLTDEDLNLITAISPNILIGNNELIVSDFQDLEQKSLDKKKEIQNLKKQIKANKIDNNNNISGAYFSVIFQTNDEKVQFLEMLGLNPDEKYFHGNEFANKIQL